MVGGWVWLAVVGCGFWLVVGFLLLVFCCCLFWVLCLFGFCFNQAKQVEGPASQIPALLSGYSGKGVS